jgi:hypothetical protein
MNRAVYLLVIGACSTHPIDPALTIEGPSQLRVDKLGPVDGPRVALDDGSRPEGMEITVMDPVVAGVEEGRVVAKARGQTKVSVLWSDQEVVWTLVVDPAVSLSLLDVPAHVVVGERATLRVEARVGQEVIGHSDTTWASSDDTVAIVDQGVITGQEPGTSFITARMGGSEAMAEIEVVER